MTDPQPNAAAAEYVSTAPETSALAKAKAGRTKKKPDRAQPWRDNIEAIAISIVTIVLFKYFVLEAYRIPTGSMQPTLMGNAETGIYDRVIVDKFSYHFRDPERFEIVVFKYPLESNKNFIKRIVGMPGEDMRLEGGDAFVRPHGETDWKVLRRPRPIQDAQLRRLDTGGEWVRFGDASAWTVDGSADGDDVAAVGSGRIAYPRSSGPTRPNQTGSIRDDYLDGYPEGMKSKISTRGKRSSINDVSDLRIAAEVEASAGTEWVRFRVHEGPRAFVFSIPGPAAQDGANASITLEGLEPAFQDLATEAAADTAVRLAAGDSVDVEVQNLNDLLEFRVDGELVASLEVPPAPERAHAFVDVEVTAAKGASTDIADLRVWRDIYYISKGQRKTEWSIPEGNYVVLGDNSQDSSDGRDWRLEQYEILQGDDAGTIVRGNDRRNPDRNADGNPRLAVGPDGVERIFFRDDLGERHVFEHGDVRDLDEVDAPFVPRDLIRGRAVLVVWPFSIKHDVYRWKWVR